MEQLRSQLVDASVVSDSALVWAAAAEADSHVVALYTRGAFAHPADVLPRPAVEGSNALLYAWHVDELESPEGPKVPRNGHMWGHLFLDGSCQRHVVRELSRAAWCVSMNSDGGKCLGEVRGPVWAHFPQTPQAAEYSARCVVAQYVSFPSTLYSDCANVVHHSQLPLPERYSGKRSYSGMIMHANHVEGNLITSIVKVKAHRDVEEAGISAHEKILRIGNRDADAGAKHGLLLHPSDNDANAEVDALVKVARAYCVLAANLLPLWPKLSLDVPYEPVPAEPRPPKPSHAWKSWSGIWR